MAASYPSAKKTFSTKASNDVIQASHVNEPQDEITAIEEALLNGVPHAMTFNASATFARLLLGTNSITIAADAITAVKSQYAVDTEAAAAADNLSTITAGSGIAAGSLLLLTPANVAHVVTVKDAVDNIKLNGGDFALDSVKKSLLLYYDGTQWVEVARAASASGAQTVAMYAATLANVDNTVAETDVLHFTVPANAWADGERIQVTFTALAKQNSGTGTKFVTFKVNVGAGAQVTLRLQGGTSGTVMNFNDDATEYKAVFRFFLQRVGADVWITNREYNFITDTVGNITPINTPFLALSQVDGVSTPANFTGSNVVTLKITLSAAHATFYVKPQSAQAVHFKS